MSEFEAFLSDPNHTVFYKYDGSELPVAATSLVPNKWDSFHVRMPCSPLSFYPVQKEIKSLVPRWKIIESSLGSPVESVHDIKRIILSYNSRFETNWNFNVLIHLFEKEYTAVQTENFFKFTYPAMVKLALSIPEILKKPIPLLKTAKARSLSFSQLQISSLLANAFFCTFPRRNSLKVDSEYKDFPTINFSTLFNETSEWNLKKKMEKLKCFIHYFDRVTEKTPNGVVTFTRRTLDKNNLTNWELSNVSMNGISVHTDNECSIFPSEAQSLKVDFANKYVGGGVLNNGCVQEEILFATHPELLISRLFTEKLSDFECLIVQGCELFCFHAGYAKSFEYVGNFVEGIDSQNERDRFGRWKTAISVIDALYFDTREEQFQELNVVRELNKAYSGFCNLMPFSEELPQTVSTGNWGCGAFRGDKHLKFIIQYMVCAQLQKDMIYHTFHEADLASDIACITNLIQKRQFSVGQMYSFVKRFRLTDDISDIFHYIKSVCNDDFTNV